MEVLHDDAEQPALLVQHDDTCLGLLGARCASPAGPAGSVPLLPMHWHGEPPQGVRQHGADGGGGCGRERDHGHHVPRPGQAAHPDQGEEISHRIREPDPDVMTDEQHDAELARLHAERDRPKALPAEVGRWDEQLTVARVRDPCREEGSQRDLGGRAGDSSPRVTTVCSGVKVQPFHVAVNRCPHDGHAWPPVSLPGIHAPWNRLPQPGQSSGECSVILIPERSSPPSLWRGRMGCSAVAFLSVSGNRLSGDAGKSPGGNIDLFKPDGATLAITHPHSAILTITG